MLSTPLTVLGHLGAMEISYDSPRGGSISGNESSKIVVEMLCVHVWGKKVGVKPNSHFDHDGVGGWESQKIEGYDICMDHYFGWTFFVEH